MVEAPFAAALAIDDRSWGADSLSDAAILNASGECRSGRRCFDLRFIAVTDFSRTVAEVLLLLFLPASASFVLAGRFDALLESRKTVDPLCCLWRSRALASGGGFDLSSASNFDWSGWLISAAVLVSLEALALWSWAEAGRGGCCRSWSVPRRSDESHCGVMMGLASLGGVHSKLFTWSMRYLRISSHTTAANKMAATRTRMSATRSPCGSSSVMGGALGAAHAQYPAAAAPPHGIMAPSRVGSGRYSWSLGNPAVWRGAQHGAAARTG